MSKTVPLTLALDVLEQYALNPEKAVRRLVDAAGTETTERERIAAAIVAAAHDVADRIRRGDLL